MRLFRRHISLAMDPHQRHRTPLLPGRREASARPDRPHCHPVAARRGSCPTWQRLCRGRGLPQGPPAMRAQHENNGTRRRGRAREAQQRRKRPPITGRQYVGEPSEQDAIWRDPGRVPSTVVRGFAQCCPQAPDANLCNYGATPMDPPKFRGCAAQFGGAKARKAAAGDGGTSHVARPPIDNADKKLLRAWEAHAASFGPSDVGGRRGPLTCYGCHCTATSVRAATLDLRRETLKACDARINNDPPHPCSSGKRSVVSRAPPQPRVGDVPNDTGLCPSLSMLTKGMIDDPQDLTYIGEDDPGRHNCKPTRLKGGANDPSAW